MFLYFNLCLNVKLDDLSCSFTSVSFLINVIFILILGNCGVIRERLTSPLIPKGWSWGGVVSDHCPVWTEIYTGKDLDKTDLSISPDAIKFTLD